MNGQMPKQTNKDGSLQIFGMDDNIVLGVSAHTGKDTACQGALKKYFFLTLDQGQQHPLTWGYLHIGPVTQEWGSSLGVFHLQPLLCAEPFLPVGSFRYPSPALEESSGS